MDTNDRFTVTMWINPTAFGSFKTLFDTSGRQVSMWIDDPGDVVTIVSPSLGSGQFGIVLGAGGAGVRMAPVPEPSKLVLFAIVAPLLRCRRVQG